MSADVEEVRDAAELDFKVAAIMDESKPPAGVPGLTEKKRRGRPVGSKNKITVISPLDSLLNRQHHVLQKRGRGRPRIIRPPALDTVKLEVSDGSRNNAPIRKDAAGKTSIKISRREGLVRPRESAALDVMLPENRVGAHPFSKTEMNIPVRHLGLIHNSNMKKYMEENGRNPRENMLVKKKLHLSMVDFFAAKRGRGRPRKIASSTQTASNRMQSKMKPMEIVTVVVQEKRRRGRPRKVLPENVKQDPISQEGSFSGMDLQNDWMGREVMNEEEASQQRAECQYPYWEAKPLAPEWTPEVTEYEDNMLDNNSIPQWGVENTAVPQSQYLGGLASEQLHHQEDLVKGLADFKSQLLSELAATRAEIREGAQLMKSAISAVSAEIHQLGQILQPLVSVITASVVSQQGPPVAFVPRPPQDTPPDDTVNFSQVSALNKSSASHQSTGFAHPPKLPTDCLNDEICLVKMEDAVEGTQSCTHQAQSAAPIMLHPHQLNMCQSKSTSSVTPIMNVPQPNVDTFGGLQGDMSLVNSFPEAPTPRSSSPANSVDFVNDSSEYTSSSSANSSKDCSLPSS